MSRLSTADFPKAHREAYSLVRQAHEAELAQNYTEALDLQIQAIASLKYYISVLRKKSEERKRAKLQRRHMIERSNTLGKYMKSVAADSGSVVVLVPPPLPSDATIDQELLDPNSTVFLSMVERRIWTNLPNPDPTSDEPLLLTPLLTPTLPVQIFHVYHEKERRLFGRSWHCLHIKDWSKSQTLYTMLCVGTWELSSHDIVCEMFRASSCENVCARITFDVTTPELRSLGCRMEIEGGTGTTIPSSPDRTKRGWSPRRFTFGDRRFAWHRLKRKEKDALASEVPGPDRNAGIFSSFFQMEGLYEVMRECPVPGSQTGKMADEVFDRPLAWGERKMFKFGGHVCTVQLAGGLDQLFREFILASMLGPLMLGLAFKDVTKKNK
ncbi:hypothetical protein BDN72DRAFT_883918 [Pluteus cervinus]|uniref:Uncharacterized protein n=1 Tax=Pluteus cervinus TaxID=181527 RepID=A0ACD3A1R6_9AGAR|nr:hypothetical protein BDN72DRAFT_883918 [Pluteus cervinus]